jgi:hypothetical protein
MTTLDAAPSTPIPIPPLPLPTTATAFNQQAQMMSDVVWAPGKFFIIHLVIFLSTNIISLYFGFYILLTLRKALRDDNDDDKATCTANMPTQSHEPWDAKTAHPQHILPPPHPNGMWGRSGRCRKQA